MSRKFFIEPTHYLVVGQESGDVAYEGMDGNAARTAYTRNGRNLMYVTHPDGKETCLGAVKYKTTRKPEYANA